jgi:uncharacterized membrane protein YeiH
MNTLIRTIEILGIFAFALSGILEARKKGMDLVGVYVVGMVTAFGGGTLRDLVLDRHPLFWVEHFWYPVILLFLSFLAGFIVRQLTEHVRVMTAVQVLDAFGLGLFAASGASVAHLAGTNIFISSLIGVMTGVFGGVMRDIICNEIPYVFQRTELYATCAFAGAWVYLLVIGAMGDEFTAVMGCIVITVVLRLFAIRYKIRLPV